MDKYLITGFSGFVAQHFVQYLCSRNVEIEILGIDIKDPCFNYTQVSESVSVQFKKKI